jgi:hypothetical protein
VPEKAVNPLCISRVIPWGTVAFGFHSLLNGFMVCHSLSGNFIFSCGGKMNSGTGVLPVLSASGPGGWVRVVRGVRVTLYKP